MIKKDKVYTKWVYDFRTEQDEKEEFFSMQMYEYEFVFQGESDPPGSWFADINDSEIESDNPGLYNGGQVYDTKYECILSEINLLESYLRICHGREEPEDIAEMEFLKREMELGLKNNAN
jgi:hypothetical protein